jgi:MFS family permease
MFTNWLPLYFKESLGMSLASAGFFGTSFVNVAAAVSPVPGGIFSDWAARKGEHYRMLLQGVLTLVAAPILLVFGRTRSFLIIGAALFVNSVLRNAADINTQPLQCDLAGNEEFANAIGITNMLNCAAGGLGIFVAGLLKGSLGLAGTFAGTVSIFAFDGIMLICCYRLFLKRDIQNSRLNRTPAVLASS